MRILQWNIRSFQRNRSFLQTAIDQLLPIILCFQETRSKAKATIDFATFPAVGRRDRGEGEGVF